MECPNCGTRAEEYEADVNAYYAKTIKCIGCEKIYYESSASRDSGEVGTRFALVREHASSSPKIKPANGGDAPGAG